MAGTPEEGAPALEARGLSKVFGGVHAVDSMDLAVGMGEAVGIIGPNGAGKTTLFNMLAGSLRPTAGRVLLRGTEITSWSADRRCRSGLARTFQVTLPFDDLTILENVLVGALVRGVTWAAAERLALELIDLVGLSHAAAKSGSQLSTGQRKRLELARALSTAPSVLLLDEVTGGVDQASVPGLIDVVRRISQTGVSLVIIEHNMTVIQDLATRLVFMHQGRKVAEGPAAEVAARPDVRALYLGENDAAA